MDNRIISDFKTTALHQTCNNFVAANYHRTVE